MNELESNVKALIIDRYGSIKKFSEKIDMPWTTLDSILKRGIIWTAIFPKKTKKFTRWQSRLSRIFTATVL